MATYGFCKQLFQRSFSRARTSLFSKWTRSSARLMRVKRVFWTVPPLATVPVLPALSFFTSKTGDTKDESKVGAKSPEQQIIENADKLYEEGNVDELYIYLNQYQNSGDANVLWRLCRATHDKAQTMEDGSKQELLMKEAFSFVQRALAIDDKNFAVYKWMGIMLNKTSKGNKEQISNSFKIKEYFMKAIELNPQDATSIHLLGIWCYEVADISWGRRKIASIIFATPPESSYEEAYEYFLKAEMADPNFYNKNLLMLGKTLQKLGKKEEANEYFTRAFNYPIKSKEDQKIHEEAQLYLKTL